MEADNIPAAQAATKFQTEFAGLSYKIGSRAGGVLLLILIIQLQ